MNIAIASYQRPQLIQKLLAFLDDMEVSREDITIFLADDEERSIYRAALGDGYYLVTGVPGLSAQRNFIESFYPKGTQVLSIDDDVSNVMVRSPDCAIGMPRSAQGHWIKAEEFHDMVSRGFRKCAEVGAHLWGVCRTSNPLFINPKDFVGLTHIDGPFFGYVVRHDPSLQLKYNQSEDAERTLRYFRKDGAVVRLGGYGFYPPSTKLNPGGLQSMGLRARAKLKDRVADQLVQEFPDLCSRTEPNEKYPFAGVKLKRIKS